MTVRAQFSAPVETYGNPISVDVSIAQLRFNAVPGFQVPYDDYLQYAPAAVVLGLKAFGYKGRSTWGELAVSTAFSAAIMAGVTNGVKYAVGRTRPNGGHRSFPSGHTATAFLAATLLHKEYSDRSPWFGIGGYWLASIVGYSRILNNRHWATDVIAGAAMGIGSVHLGYFLSDLIFKKYQKKDRENTGVEEVPLLDPDHKYYEIGTFMAQRLVLGGRAGRTLGSVPTTGGTVALETKIPLIPVSGLTARVSAGSLTFNNPDATSAEANAGSSTELSDGSDRTAATRSSNVYSVLVGGYYTLRFLKICEADFRAMAGYAFHAGRGLDISAGVTAGVCAGENFRIKILADYEGLRLAPFTSAISSGDTASGGGSPSSSGNIARTSSRPAFLHSILLGLSFATVW